MIKWLLFTIYILIYKREMKSERRRLKNERKKKKHNNEIIEKIKFLDM